jgi:malonyl-CoA/methylmalonyl-CoA synthetase
MTEIVRRAAGWPERTAVVADGERYTYARLLHASAELARMMTGGTPVLPGGDERAGGLAGARVAFLVGPGFDYVAWQWAIWRAGGVAVPLSSSQAPAEWDFIVGDVEPAIVVGDDESGALAAIARRHGSRHLPSNRLSAGPEALPSPTAVSQCSWNTASAGSADAALGPRPSALTPALILYTSGTTSRPKGVVLTHAHLEAQMATLVEAWGWRADDRILHVLPLNHVHGIVNVLGCALWCGACCEFLAPFDAQRVWARMARGGVTLFMAVPTIYTKLLAAYDAAGEADRQGWAAGARALRLMVSGSAALPVTVLDRWREVTGHVLLERYGMTEIGMALSNPLDGPRRPGSVGTPLPGVDVRLVDERSMAVAPGSPGEIEVRGPTVFQEYWRRPAATREAFRDGWFRTGDVAVIENGAYRILGRSSVDIIKTGGYKVSALEIEEALREHPGVAEVAVVGVPDEEWGERVAAAVVPRPGTAVTLDDLRRWASSRLAKYKLPTRLVALTSLPRNAMGKVVKSRVKELFSGQRTADS